MVHSPLSSPLSSPVIKGKVAITILSIVLMGLGLFSHFKSDWTVTVSLGEDLGSMHLYELCSGKLGKAIRKEWNVPCPNISLEKYYVSVIIIFFILSLPVLIISFAKDMSVQPFKIMDVGYHAIGTLLLLIAAISYIVSAEGVNALKEKFEELAADADLFEPGVDLDEADTLRRGEKLAAASLTFVQSLLYGIVTYLILQR